MMKAYDGFANVYDIMQVDVDYPLWIAALDNRIKTYNYGARQILEVACGTATIGLGLSRKGYVVDGLDTSEEMLTVAQHKAKEANLKMNFYRQDMSHMTLNKKYDVIVVPCDGVNYLLDDVTIKQFFSRVAAHLKPDGVFIFDLSTLYKLSTIIGNNTFSETFDKSAYIWENSFDPCTNKLEFLLTLFIEDGENSYQRIEEFHEQRSYLKEDIKSWLTSWFEILEICDGDTFEPLAVNSERMCFVCKLGGVI